MKVYVERCTKYFRLIFPGGKREHVMADTYWNREIATEALDIAEKVYGLSRTKVRFIHR